MLGQLRNMEMNMVLDVINARIAAISMALDYELDLSELQILNAELDRLIELLVELNKVQYE